MAVGGTAQPLISPKNGLTLQVGQITLTVKEWDYLTLVLSDYRRG